MGNSAQLFLGCDEALGLGCPPFGRPAVRQQHHRVKVHMHRVQDQAKKVAHSEPNPLSANYSQGDHSGARDPNQRRNHGPQA
jgi:hypothetical protein